MRRRVAQQVRYYVDEGGRQAAVTRAQVAGHYEEITDRWLLRSTRRGREIEVVDGRGRTRDISLDAMTPRLRMRLFREGEHGLEPMWVWLNHDGTPRPKRAWYKTFSRANERVERVLEIQGPAQLWARPHMLRHSFALHWYCIATFVAWQRIRTLSEREQREFRDQLGDVWYLVATLLGHSSPEVTKSVYLEPFNGVQIEELIALMDADDQAAMQRLVNTVVADEPRVLKAVEQ